MVGGLEDDIGPVAFVEVTVGSGAELPKREEGIENEVGTGGRVEETGEEEEEERLAGIVEDDTALVAIIVEMAVGSGVDEALTEELMT